MKLEIRGSAVVIREALPSMEAAFGEQPNAVALPLDSEEQFVMALYGMGYLPPEISAGMGMDERKVRRLVLRWSDWFPGAPAAGDEMHRLRLREAEVAATDQIQQRLLVPHSAEGSPKLGEVARALEVTAKVGRLAEEKAIGRRAKDAREAMSAVMDVLSKLGGRGRVITGTVQDVGIVEGGEDSGGEYGGGAPVVPDEGGRRAPVAVDCAGDGAGEAVHGVPGAGAAVGRPAAAYGEDSRTALAPADKSRLVGRQGFRRTRDDPPPRGSAGGDVDVGELLGKGAPGDAGRDDHESDRVGAASGSGNGDSGAGA